MIATVCRLAPVGERTLFGLDYEVTGDRQLIEKLRPKVPKPAIAAFDVFDRASADGWAKWAKTGNPGDIPTFSLDPALVHAVQSAWANPDPESVIILNILAETLEINRLQQISNWASNERRAAQPQDARSLAHVEDQCQPGTQHVQIWRNTCGSWC